MSSWRNELCGHSGRINRGTEASFGKDPVDRYSRNGHRRLNIPSYLIFPFWLRYRHKVFQHAEASEPAGKRRLEKRGHFELPADMTGYLGGHNSVESIPFQVSQDLPQPLLPLHQQINPNDLRKLIETHPLATLHDLCELVQKERGITMSTTAMCRLLKRYGILRGRGHHQPVSLTLVA